VIIKIDGLKVNTVPELQEQVGKHRPGDKANITYIRNNKENTVQLVLKNETNTTSVVTAEMKSDQVYGATFSSLSSSEMKSFNIDYGVKVTDLSDGKFNDLGIKRGYIILNVNGKKVKSPPDIRQFTNNESNLKSIGGIQSDGTIFSYQFGN
jgi:S1-C subfamily serine protease